VLAYLHFSSRMFIWTTKCSIIYDLPLNPESVWGTEIEIWKYVGQTIALCWAQREYYYYVIHICQCSLENFPWAMVSTKNEANYIDVYA